MPDDSKMGHLSVADVSSSIALGLQRAIDARPDTFKDRWLIYGGRLEFTVQVNPQAGVGPMRSLSELGSGSS